MYIENSTGVTWTSSGYGKLFGNGKSWWGYVSYLLISENRPRMLNVHNATNLLMEHWHFVESPYWTTYFNDVANLTIRYSSIDNRRNNADDHSLWNLGAFNTDGFDVAGRDIHIHDVDVWNQDDCICVKGINGDSINSKCAENMLFENIRASGLGLTIGSIGASHAHTCVKNITFRNCTMHNTFKGIYLKSRPSTGTAEISNILYEDITIQNAE
jgi:polygalacturonase